MDGSEAAAEVQQDTVEQAAVRIRELNERLLRSATEAGARSLDAYERALEKLAATVGRAGGATPLDWVFALAQIQAEYIRDISVAHTAALRILLD